MQDYERENLRQKLDEELLPFRLGRRWKIGGEGWLKNIRQAVGLPVDVVAKRLGVCRWEVHRMEQAEKASRIKLETLRRAAKALGCELVYALVPKKGTLEDLEREWAREEKMKPWLVEIGWREALLGALRTTLRREGFRVRPRKTERGVAQQKAAFKETMELVKFAEVMGPEVGEVACHRVSELASQRAEGEGRTVSKADAK
jgi:predicted DNA-binding mobile mystery protein A